MIRICLWYRGLGKESFVWDWWGYEGRWELGEERRCGGVFDEVVFDEFKVSLNGIYGPDDVYIGRYGWSWDGVLMK